MFLPFDTINPDELTPCYERNKFRLTPRQEEKTRAIDLVLSNSACFILADARGSGTSYIAAALAASPSVETKRTLYLSFNESLSAAAKRRFLMLESPKEVLFETYKKFLERKEFNGKRSRVILDDLFFLPRSGIIVDAVIQILATASQVLLITHDPFRSSKVAKAILDRLRIPWKTFKLNSSSSQMKYRSEVLITLDLYLKGLLSCDHFDSQSHAIKIMKLKIEANEDRVRYNEMIAGGNYGRTFLATELSLKIKIGIDMWKRDLESGYVVLLMMPETVKLHAESKKILDNYIRVKPSTTVLDMHDTIYIFSNSSQRRASLRSLRPLRQYILDIGQDPSWLHYQSARCNHLGKKSVETFLVLFDTFHDRLSLSKLSRYNYTFCPSQVYLAQNVSLTLLEIFSRWLYARVHHRFNDIPQATKLYGWTNLCHYISSRNMYISEDLALTFLSACCRVHPHAKKWLCPPKNNQKAYKLTESVEHPISKLPWETIQNVLEFCKGRHFNVYEFLQHCDASIFDCKCMASFFERMQRVPLHLQEQVWFAWLASQELLISTTSNQPMLINVSRENTLVQSFRTSKYTVSVTISSMEGDTMPSDVNLPNKGLSNFLRELRHKLEIHIELLPVIEKVLSYIIKTYIYLKAVPKRNKLSIKIYIVDEFDLINHGLRGSQIIYSHSEMKGISFAGAIICYLGEYTG